MDREKQRATGRGVQSKCAADLARLAQIESIERLVGEQHRLRRQESDREQHAFALALREFADADVDQRLEIETLEYVCPFTGRRPAKKPFGVPEHPANRLVRPRRDAIRHIEEDRRGRAPRPAGWKKTRRSAPRRVRSVWSGEKR